MCSRSWREEKKGKGRGERGGKREKRREDRGARRKGTGKMLRGETVASFLGPTQLSVARRESLGMRVARETESNRGSGDPL